MVDVCKIKREGRSIPCKTKKEAFALPQVRLASVFWASAAAALLPALQPYINDPELEISCTAVVGVVGGVYAGSLGPSHIPSLCTHFARPGIEWRR